MCEIRFLWRTRAIRRISAIVPRRSYRKMFKGFAKSGLRDVLYDLAIGANYFPLNFRREYDWFGS